jgi:hypothetical protein
VRIGMKRPDAFVALYAMSSCCLLIDPASGGDVVMRAARERRRAALFSLHSALWKLGEHGGAR